MKRPSPFDYLIGHPVSYVLMLGAAVYVVYHWWTQTNTTSSLPPILAVVMVCWSSAANTRVTRYQDFKREWDAINGPARPLMSPAMKRAGYFVLALAMWAGLAYWLYENYRFERHSDTYLYAALTLAALTLAILLQPVQAALGHVLARHRTSERDFVVRPALGVPRVSPAPREVLGALPDYCQELLAREQPASAEQPATGGGNVMPYVGQGAGR